MAINDPRDIPGLLVWYSAEAETGYADGAAMTGWTDLSGNGFDATAAAAAPAWQATTGPAGGPALRFGPSGAGAPTGGFTLPDIFGSATAAEIMAQVKSDGADCGLWTMAPFTGSNDESHYPFAGTVYEAFGLPSGMRRSFSPTLAITSWRRYNLWSAPGDWAASLDGTTQATWASTGVAFTPTPRIGAGSHNSVPDYRFAGYMSCVVIYDRKLTTTERADLAAWLQANPSGGAAPAPTAVTGTLEVAAPSATVSITDGTLAQLAETAPSASVSFSGVSQGGALTLVAPAASVALSGSVPDVAAGSLAVTAPGAVVSLAGNADATVQTSTTNAFNGRVRRGFATVETTVAVVDRPATITRGHDMDKAIALTTPTLVDGRPT